MKLPLRVRMIGEAFYWQPTPAVKRLGFHAEALGKDPVKAFARAADLNGMVGTEKIQGNSTVFRANSVAALIDSYQREPRYARLSQKTRRVYEYIFARIGKMEGQSAVTDLKRRDLKAIYREVTARNGLGMANAIMRVWRFLLAYAVDEEWIIANPAERLELTAAPPRRRIWSDAERAAFSSKAIEMGRRSLALAVALAWDTGQRQGDLLALSWSDWNGSGFAITQHKTGSKVTLPLMPEARKMLAETPRVSTRILVSEFTQRPYTNDHFRHQFVRVRRAAGLPEDLQFRDLRRSALTDAGDHGATDGEIMAMSGHKSREVVSIYVVPTGTQAAAAQRKRQKGRKRNRSSHEV